MSDEPVIENVSDTALWVANFRALETERTDAVFKDPLAARLVGERGRRLSESMPHGRLMAWVMTVRTSAIDRLIYRGVELGADTVVNLGTGLDTRPYRMQLPPELSWIEVDFPHLIELKNQKLAGERPVCRLERIGIDLASPAARREVFARIGTSARTAVIITEGVLPYLSREEVAALAEDLRAVPSFRFWIQDYQRRSQGRFVPRRLKKRLKSAPFRFQVQDWFRFFSERGWNLKESISAFEEGIRLGRPAPFIFPWSLLGWVLPPRLRREMRRMMGYCLLEKG